MTGFRRTLFVAPCAWWLSAATIVAQDLEPRAYSASPVGTTFLVSAVGRSTGGVLTDPSLPVLNVEAKLTTWSAGLGHTFGVAGRQALVVVVIPYAWGRISGDVGESRREVTREGLADPRIKLSVNLFGGPALAPREFARARRGTLVGASVTVATPVGQYNPTHLINLGANRWSFKPEVGVSQPIGRWALEGYLGVWFFTTNTSFFRGDSRRSQDPIVAAQGHLSYTFPSRAWIALDGTWYRGGQTVIDGLAKADLLRNTRAGATFSLPVGRRQSVKLSYTTGASTRVGADFDTFGVAWQIVFF